MKIIVNCLIMKNAFFCKQGLHKEISGDHMDRTDRQGSGRDLEMGGWRYADQKVHH